jgi:hypothetical protein
MSTRHPFDTATFKLVYDAPAQPAAGAPYIIDLPTNIRIELVAAYFSFTASAAVVNRVINVALFAAGVPNYVWLPPRPHTAAQTVVYSFGRGITAEPGVAGTANNCQATLGVGMIFDNVDQIRVGAQLIDVNDQFNFLRIYYKEWLQGHFPA